MEVEIFFVSLWLKGRKDFKTGSSFWRAPEESQNIKNILWNTSLADPSFNICGEKEWVYTRLDWKKDLLGFVVPLMIFAEKGHGIDSDMELRTSHYLVDMYSDMYPVLKVHPYFESWKEIIEIFNTIAQHVPFHEYNLWQHDKLLEEYLNLYLKIQKDINK